MNTSSASARSDGRGPRLRLWIPFLSIAALFLCIVAYQLYATNRAALLVATKDANNLTLVIVDGLRINLDVTEHVLSGMVSNVAPDAMRLGQTPERTRAMTDWLAHQVGTIAYFAQCDRWFRAIVTDGRLLHGV